LNNFSWDSKSKSYTFIDNHPTGGVSTVRITESMIIRYMKNKDKKHRSNKELIDDFVLEFGCLEN
jgi:hypothetical protein